MTQLGALRKALESDAPLAPAYLLRGDERFFSELAIRRIRERATKEGQEVVAHDTQDPEFELSRLLEDLSGGGLFCAARCVVVRGADSIAKKVGKDDAPFVRAARAAIESDEFPGTLVVAASSLRADSRLAKAIAAAGGTSVSCRRLYDTPPPWDPDPRKVELVRYVEMRARGLKVEMDSDLAVYLCAATGNDLYAIDDQLEKLRHTPRAERRAALGWDKAGNPFELAQLLAGGEAARALGGIESLFRGGFQERDGKRLVDEAGLVAILLGSLRKVVRECLAMAQEIEAGGAPKPARGGPRAAEAVERARRRSAARWQRMLEEATELERRSKSSARVDANDLSVLAMRWRS